MNSTERLIFELSRDNEKFKIENEKLTKEIAELRARAKGLVFAVDEYLPLVGKRYIHQYDDHPDSLREKADAIEAENKAYHKLRNVMTEAQASLGKGE